MKNNMLSVEDAILFLDSNDYLNDVLTISEEMHKIEKLINVAMIYTDMNNRVYSVESAVNIQKNILKVSKYLDLDIDKVSFGMLSLETYKNKDIDYIQLSVENSITNFISNILEKIKTSFIKISVAFKGFFSKIMLMMSNVNRAAESLRTKLNSTNLNITNFTDKDIRRLSKYIGNVIAANGYKIDSNFDKEITEYLEMFSNVNQQLVILKIIDKLKDYILKQHTSITEEEKNASYNVLIDIVNSINMENSNNKYIKLFMDTYNKSNLDTTLIKPILLRADGYRMSAFGISVYGIHNDIKYYKPEVVSVSIESNRFASTRVEPPTLDILNKIINSIILATSKTKVLQTQLTEQVNTVKNHLNELNNYRKNYYDNDHIVIKNITMLYNYSIIASTKVKIEFMIGHVKAIKNTLAFVNYCYRKYKS